MVIGGKIPTAQLLKQRHKTRCQPGAAAVSQKHVGFAQDSLSLPSNLYQGRQKLSSRTPTLLTRHRQTYRYCKNTAVRMSGEFTCTTLISPRRIKVNEPCRFPAVSLLSTSSNILGMCTHGPTGSVYTCTHCCSTGFGLKLKKKKGNTNGNTHCSKGFQYSPCPTVLKWHLQSAVMMVEVNSQLKEPHTDARN